MNGQDPQNGQTQAGNQNSSQSGTPTPPPAGDQGGTPPTPATPPKKVVSDEELGIGSVGDFTTTIHIPPHNLQFNEMYFLKLLSGSISLMKEEKMKIVESVPKLSQYQIDELVRILEEEKRKFAELDEKHQAKVQELQKKQEEDWRYLEMKKEEESKNQEATDEAEKLRQQIAQGSMPKQDNPPTNS